jgi:MFS transporter, Spinster family, sphingosine-1-phosphate transporter
MQRTSHRTYMLNLLTLVYAFNFLDRNVLMLLLEEIKRDLVLSDTQLGLLSGMAFALFYSTLGIPIARWADRGNRITIISITSGLWSVLVIYCGMATSYLQLLLARVGVAVGEAGCVPPAQSLISDHFSRDERASAMSYYMLGVPLSTVLSFGIAGWINEWYGWRMAFIAVGVPGVLLTVLVKFSLREPRLDREKETTAQAEAPANASYFSIFRALWSQAAYRYLVVGFTLLYLFSFGIAQWMPSYLIRKHHIDTGELGTYYAFIWGFGGMIGTYIGGRLANQYARNNERLQLKAMAVVLVAFIPLYLGIYLSDSKRVVFTLMAISAPLFMSIFGPMYAMIQEVVAANMRAMSVAIVLFFSNLLGIGLGPVLVGMMSDLLRPVYGDLSLQVALLVWTPGYLWAAFNLMQARKSIESDIATARSIDEVLLQSAASK